MKVAAIVGGFPKLSETFILRHITSLIDLGHDVDIYARRNPRESTCQPDVIKYRLLDKTHYLNIPSHRFTRMIRAFRVLFSRALFHPLAMFQSLNLVRYGSLYAIINNLIVVDAFLDNRYDAILCYWGGNGIDFIILKQVFAKTRFITRFGGDDYFLGDECGVGVFSNLKELADNIIVQTDCFGRVTLRRYGFDDKKIVTWRHVIPVSQIEFKERTLEESEIGIISVARLVKKKGLEFSIQAMAELRRRNPERRIKYRIVGDGPLTVKFQALIKELNLEGVVELVGAKTTPEVFKLLDQSHIFLLPSLMEQAGYVLLEAQSSGLPIVATRVGGVPEMVAEHESAILIAPGSISTIVDALENLFLSSNQWPLMGRKGRAYVSQYHDSQRLMPQLVGVLQGDCI
jgi:colanic acid/amylovoran biosynthesis glycosyltransferase